MFITNGTVCDWMVVQAITDPDQKVHKSFSQLSYLPMRRGSRGQKSEE